MSVTWFIVWLIADGRGDNERPPFDPVNSWAAALLLAAALDLGGSHARSAAR